MKPSISFIVITYNNEKEIQKCLESIKNQGINFNIIIVDNNSEDKTLSLIKKLSTHTNNLSLYNEKELGKIAKVHLIKNKKNLGFAQAVNQGINYAQKKFHPDFYFLINPDAYLEKNCLIRILKKIQESDSWRNVLVSPLIIDPRNNQPWFSGAKINWLKLKTNHIKLQTINYKLQTDYLTGCALLIPKKITRVLSSSFKNRRKGKIKIFDEIFFLYYEDVDFSLRAQKTGFKLKIIPQAICYHQESSSSDSKDKNYYLVKSGLIFFHKYYSKLLLPYFWLTFYLRFFYHKYISNKKEVFQAMKDFKNSD